MFKILEIKPMFTGVVTTAKNYVGSITTSSGLIVDATKVGLNMYQTVIAVGDMVKDVKPGDIVKINYKRYLVGKHVPGQIENNVQKDNLTATYEIPQININGEDCLYLQSNDLEYVVTKYEVDEGGLLQ